MVSDKNNLPDEDIFDDVDFDSADDGVTDVLDEPWDDVVEDDTSANNKSSGSKKAKKTSQSGKKSSKSLLVIIGVAAAGALGLAIIGSGALTSQTPASPAVEGDLAAQGPQQDAGPTEVTDASIPPMPVPMAADAGSNEAGLPAPAVEAPPTDSALTPMPGAQELASSDTQVMQDLNASEIPAALEPAPMLSGESAPELESATSLDSSATGSLNQAPADKTVSDVPVTSDSSPVESSSNELPVETKPAPQSSSAGSEQVSESTQQAAAIPVAQPAVDTSALTERISGLESNLATLQKSLDESVASSNAKIETLLATIQSLENKIQSSNDVSSLTENKEEPSSSSLKEEVLQNITPPEPTSAPVLRTDSPAREVKTKQATISWTLRSARNGAAVVSAAGSNELRNIEVGDSLPGIGKVKSIALENGSWVVRGTRANITR